MNPSDWRKAATLVTQHKQEVTMADTDQSSSMPLSQIAIDDSGPPIVHYGTHMPVAASTPTGTHDTTRPTNTSLMSEATEQVNVSSENNLPTAKQESMEEVETVINVPESLKIDIGHTS